VTDFDPAQTRDIYNELAGAWRANADFAEMQEHILRGGTYLREFGGKSAEPAEQYELRKAVSLALDLCEDFIDLRVGNIFRVPPVRTFDASPYRGQIEQILPDVDGGGTSMDDFMRDALRRYYVNGVDIVVDKDAPAARPRSRDDEKHLRVYLAAFGPLERPDWACDHGGGYTFVRYDLGPTARADETAGDPDERRYLTLTRTGWRLHVVGADADGKRALRTLSGRHTLGVCPVVQFYFKRSGKAEYDAVPLSLLTRLTPIAKFMLNLVSQGQLDLYLSVAFFVLFGVEAKDVPTEMGAAKAWAFNNPEARMQNVVATIEHIAEKRAWLQLCVQAMLRVGKLTGITADLKGRAASGVQAAIERGDLDNEMSATASQAEAVERRLIQLMLSRKHPPAGGGLIPMADIGYTVHYNKKYVLASAEELIRQARRLGQIGVAGEVPSLMRLALRKVADALSKEGDADYKAALAEIRAAAFAQAGAAARGA